MKKKSPVPARSAKSVSQTRVVREATKRVKAAKQRVKAIKAELKVARAAVKAAKAARKRAEALARTEKTSASNTDVKSRAPVSRKKKVVRARTQRPTRIAEPAPSSPSATSPESTTD